MIEAGEVGTPASQRATEHPDLHLPRVERHPADNRAYRWFQALNHAKTARHQA
jgi:hypothetical protein